jgi:predicted regulator of Ras-like GTPase activity (Roadblock/LC7/MglB family)
MGGLLSDDKGNVLAHSFPPYFDASTLKDAAGLLQDNTAGLQDVTGGVKLYDIRFELGRLIIKTLPHLFVVVLCQPTVNLQLLFISMNVAIKKIEKLSPEQFVIQALKPNVSAPGPAAKAPEKSSAPPAPAQKQHALERLQGWVENKVG